MNSPGTIAITGASSGLGAALAVEYAAPGRTLALAARCQERLEQVERNCRLKGAEVLRQQVDITKANQVGAWIDEIEQNTAIDLMIANAGIFSGHGPEGQLEEATDVIRQIETNLIGTMITVNAAVTHMQGRKSGQIAMISSLAALQPLADAPGYSASKAGIRAYGEALREYLADKGIAVSVILPGHIETAQTAVHIGMLPGIISPEKAARIIRTRLDRGETYITFPHGVHFLVRLGRLLPWRLRASMNRPFRFHVKGPSGPELRKDKACVKSEGR